MSKNQRFSSSLSEKKSFKITSYRKENFSTTGLPSKRIKRRSDDEISSVERGDKRSKSQKKKKKKKGKQELVNLKFSIARRYYELKFDTHIRARWFEKRGGGGGGMVGYVKINFHSLVENLSSFDLSARARVPKLRNNNRERKCSHVKIVATRSIHGSLRHSFSLSLFEHYNYRPPGNFSFELDGHN